MRPKRKDFGRVCAQRVKYDFFGPDRASIRTMVKIGAFDYLPEKESMKDHIYRGDNAWTDNTRYGEYNGRSVNVSAVRRIVESFVGKKYDDLTSYVSKTFHGKDRQSFEYYISNKFNTDVYRFGYKISHQPVFVIDDAGLIQHNHKYRTIRQIINERHKDDVRQFVCVYCDETHAYVAHDGLWYRCLLGTYADFLRTTACPISKHGVEGIRSDACGMTPHPGPKPSYLAGYVVHATYPGYDVYGDARYHDKWVLERESVNHNDLRRIKKFLDS